MIQIARMVSIVAVCIACNVRSFAQDHRFDHPPTTPKPKYETFHGVKVVDPYPWLQESKSPDVRRWVQLQNNFTARHLRKAVDQTAIRRRLNRLLNVDFFSPPYHFNGKYFFKRNGVLFYRIGRAGKDREIFDPLDKDKDGKLAALDWWYPSWDGRFIAYGISYDGREESTLYIQEVATGRVLADHIDRTRSCSVAWLPDSSGFFYTRYPAPGAVPKGEEQYHQHVYYHEIGVNPARDVKVFGDNRPAEDDVSVQISPNGRWVAITAFRGWSKSEIFLRDNLSKDKSFKPLIKKPHHNFEITLLDEAFYVLTDQDAPRYCCYRIDPAKLERKHWRLIIPESKHKLEKVLPMPNHVAAVYLHDVYAKLRILELKTKKWHDVPVWPMAAIEKLSDGRDEFFFTLESYTKPIAVYRLDLTTMEKTAWDRAFPPLNVIPYVVKQVKYKSKDGTTVPMTLIYKRDLKLDGNNPTMLYGYGGFNDSLTPIFYGDRFLILENGGVFAIPNIRGGGEYGEDWHRAGILGNRQNAIDDFIAAAEWLIKKKYTNRMKLAVKGESNGGLLVAACITQRPELFRAAVISVAPLDMLHSHQYYDAKRYIPEDGDVANPKHFKWLYAYSPYHRVKKGTAYPAVMVTTRSNDTRVAPYESRKFAALLQASTTSNYPVLFREQPQAGHLDLTVEELVDLYSFLIWQLGMKL